MLQQLLRDTKRKRPRAMIIALLLVPVVTSVALWLGADALATRCSPKWAARALVVLTISVALTTGLC